MTPEPNRKIRQSASAAIFHAHSAGDGHRVTISAAQMTA